MMKKCVRSMFVMMLALTMLAGCAADGVQSKISAKQVSAKKLDPGLREAVDAAGTGVCLPATVVQSE